MPRMPARADVQVWALLSVLIFGLSMFLNWGDGSAPSARLHPLIRLVLSMAIGLLVSVQPPKRISWPWVWDALVLVLGALLIGLVAN